MKHEKAGMSNVVFFIKTVTARSILRVKVDDLSKHFRIFVLIILYDYYLVN